MDFEISGNEARVTLPPGFKVVGFSHGPGGELEVRLQRPTPSLAARSSAFAVACNDIPPPEANPPHSSNPSPPSPAGQPPQRNYSMARLLGGAALHVVALHLTGCLLTWALGF